MTITTHRLSGIALIGSLLCLSFLLYTCSPTKTKWPDNSPRKIEVLFLGHDSEHHNSEAYMPVLASALANKGINFTYTESLESLKDEFLADFDALMIYANHDEISKSQEKALLSFVAEGKGLLPIHCASYCFRNSDEYVELVGAQFKDHGTGVFRSDIIEDQKDHPVLAGFEGFESWDETYVHSQHNEDRTLLMERKEGDHTEAWTWVRNYKKGRVFYTASGHDERTWLEPQFHKLMENAIVWSVGERVQNLWKQLPSFPTHTYTEAVIPNYEKRDPAPKLQAPLSAEESQKLMQIPPGFELELFAQEPDIINPISMAWDERGRLWVIETVDYPNTVRDEDGIGDDRIKIVEDTDGDGKADKFTVFADKLNIPTSLVFANDGVIVSQAPHFLFLKDTDGDDKADIREEIITGWGTFDTHAGPSNLAYGHDNMIWGSVGYSGFKGSINGAQYQFGQGFYRFRPDVSHFEYMTRTTNNTWGLGFTEDFQVFGSTANNTHSVYMAIPDRYYEGVKGMPRFGSKKIDGHYSFHPITDKVRQVDVFGGFTAAAGFNLYTARNYPEEYWNKVGFVCAPTGRLVHKAVLSPDGAGYTETDGWNMVASNDNWFGPVDAEVGPDGDLWVLDWYNFIIQHNPTPTGFENGKGNAHINPLRDKLHGRIYRLKYKGAPTYTPLHLSKDDPNALIAALSHDNMFWRVTAQRLLVERGQKDVVSDLIALGKSARKDAIGLKPALHHALWTLHGLGEMNGSNEEALDLAKAALQDEVPAIRRTALMVLPRISEGNDAIFAANMLEDTDLNVRLNTVLAMADMPASEELGSKLYELSKKEEWVNDLWLSRALYCAAVKHQNGFWQAYKNDPNAGGEKVIDEKEIDWINTTDFADWQKVELPNMMAQMDKGYWDGILWFKRNIEVSSEDAGKAAMLHLGPIYDSDSAYVNGKWIGGIRSGYNTPRSYKIPKGFLREGVNTITVKLWDYGGSGGFRGLEQDMKVEIDGIISSIAGEWFVEAEEEFLNAHSKLFGPEKSMAEFFGEFYGENSSDMMATKVEADVVLDLGVVINEMKYDQSELVVEAGQSVEIVFNNTDFMQHNLLILNPGSLEEVGAAADLLATEQDAAERNYVPDSQNILYSTALVNPNSSVSLRFTAPDKPGEYPFVCTFPGHWRQMNGILKVVPKKSV